MRAIQFLLLPLILSIILIGSARADHEEEEPICNSRQAFIEELRSEYGESILFLGLIDQNTGIELYINQEEGTWTLFTTNIQGKSCVVFSGYSFDLPK